MWTYPDDPAIARGRPLALQRPAIAVGGLAPRPGRRMSQLLPRTRTSTPRRCCGWPGSATACSPRWRSRPRWGRSGAAIAVRLVVKYERRTEDRAAIMSLPEADLEATCSREWTIPFRVCDYIAWQVSAIEGAPGASCTGRRTAATGPSRHARPILKTYGDRFTAEAPVANATIPAPRRGRTWRSRPRSPRDARGCPRGPGDLLARGRRARSGSRTYRSCRSELGGSRSRITRLRRAERRHRPPRVRAARLDLAGRGGPQRRSLGALLRVRRPPRDHARAGRRDRAGDGAYRSALGDLSRAAWTSHRAGARRNERFEPGQPLVATSGSATAAGSRTRRPRSSSAGRGRPAGACAAASRCRPVYSAPSRDPVRSELFGEPREELKPKRTDRFNPDAATRPLAAFEEFDAMQLDLNDWFNLTRRGSYYVQRHVRSRFGDG